MVRRTRQTRWLDWIDQVMLGVTAQGLISLVSAVTSSCAMAVQKSITWFDQRGSGMSDRARHPVGWMLFPSFQVLRTTNVQSLAHD